ncbi:hypothetical protein DESC_710112 [Desulfosarcina cetonica]|nr:hypothetical protein DESC_710112 [Desulfosarcina cetonica]
MTVNKKTCRCQHRQPHGKGCGKPVEAVLENGVLQGLAAGRANPAFLRLQQSRIDHADDSVRDVVGQSLETQHRGPLSGGGLLIDEITHVKADHVHGGKGHQGRQEPHEGPEKGHADESDQGGGRGGPEAEQGRAVLGDPQTDPGNEDPGHGHGRSHQAKAGFGQLDHAIVLTGQGDDHAQDPVKKHAEKDHHEDKGGLENPASRGQGEPECRPDGATGRRVRVVFPARRGFLQAQDGGQGQQGQDEGQIDRQPEGLGLGENMRPAHGGGHARHQARIINGGAHVHGKNEEHRAQAHLTIQNPPPLAGQAAGLQGVIGNGFVGTAGGGFGQTAEHAIEHKKDEQQGNVSPGGQAEDGHLQEHRAGREDQQSTPADDIGQGPRRHLGQDDGGCPDRIEDRKLGDAEPEIEKHDREYRIVETAVEKYPERDETADIFHGEWRRCGRMRCVRFQRKVLPGWSVRLRAGTGSATRSVRLPREALI